MRAASSRPHHAPKACYRWIGFSDDPEKVLPAGYTGTDTAAGAMAVITRADLIHFLSSTATTISPSDGLRIN
ncbi:hypothetical protein AWV79_17450 [Cupriavidus sp. UYMMa02A]|nr:hypothetical protein AWV79_17450 [Cupriavidus sp. UYMMa02A]